MHEYDRLYQRWKRYRFKKILKTILFLLILCLVVVGLLFAYRFKTHENITTKKLPKTNNIILPQKEFEKHLKAPSYKYRSKRKKSIKKKPIRTHRAIQQPVPKTIIQKPLIIKNDQVDINELKRLFFKAPTPSKALIIARRYYQQKRYKESALWALKANELDKSNKESWLLFAKSLAKQGKKREAINVLRIYYKKSGSKDARILIQDIINGVFR